MDLAWWIAVIGVPLVVGIFLVDLKIYTEHQRRSAGIETATQMRAAELHGRIDAVLREFNDYRVEAAKSFVTMNTLDGMKKDLGAMFERLERKFDRLSDRIDEK